MDESKRQQDASPVEQSVGRAVRDTLPLVQHTMTELSHAIEDLVSACGSRRPANTMPSMLRAQSAAASLAAMLESMMRLVALTTAPQRQTPAEEIISRAISTAEPDVSQPQRTAPEQSRTQETPPAASYASPGVIEMPAPSPRVEEEIPIGRETHIAPRRPSFDPALAVPDEAAYETPSPEVTPAVIEEAPPEESAPVEAAPAESSAESAPVEAVHAMHVTEAPPAAPQEIQEVAAAEFRVENLPADQQELHRKANRHAKVSMQDIRLLRPKEVVLGMEHRDLCSRLKSDLDKARKEYVRRFQPILEHPVDYFHIWAVEVLADGKVEALGEYPYPSPVNRH
ncbi:MAG: hypothetical protein GZ088_13915 [Acidipila sp.]|nr:hypothetical protein [Acidipila sp.]